MLLLFTLWTSLEVFGQNCSNIELNVGGIRERFALTTYHLCALKDDNSAVCWGADDFHEDTPDYTDFVKIVAGQQCVCGLRESGTAVCWGGSEGEGWTHDETTIENVIDITCVVWVCCFLHVDGSIECVLLERDGIDRGNQISGAPTTADYVALVGSNGIGGGYTNCALRNDCTLYCWGVNTIPWPAAGEDVLTEMPTTSEFGPGSTTNFGGPSSCAEMATSTAFCQMCEDVTSIKESCAECASCSAVVETCEDVPEINVSLECPEPVCPTPTCNCNCARR